jgi:glycosyltransferase involved in cell wall biosynthesis
MKNGSFQSATILLPVINETTSLVKTVETIRNHSDPDVKEFLMIVCEKTKRESLEICDSFRQKDPERFVVHHQKLPFLGGAIREAFDRARGSHVVLMASDLETNPEDVRPLIEEAKRTPEAIVTASRWIQGGRFEGYDRLKWFLNYIFQKFFSLLYGTRLSDMTYGFRIFPAAVVRSIRWEELRHPFLFETLIKPLRLGVPIREIPSVWKAREEGESQNTFLRNFSYFRTGLKVRFYPREKLLKETS